MSLSTTSKRIVLISFSNHGNRPLIWQDRQKCAEFGAQLVTTPTNLKSLANSSLKL